jgi:uncharacterized protein (DUF1919 family)
MKTKTGSYLPVEAAEGRTYTDLDVFDSEEHKSHLLSCAEKRHEWEEQKKRIIKNVEKQLKMDRKELLR